MGLYRDRETAEQVMRKAITKIMMMMMTITMMIK
jgi:hypothetical protein